MKKTILCGLLLPAAVLLTACAAQFAEPPTEPFLPPLETQVPLPTATPSELAPEPAEPALTPIPGGFPAAAFAARESLADLLGVSVETIEIQKVEPAEWPDGCLGLARPGEMCTMATVPGYRIFLLVGTSQYVYRADERGTFLRREEGVSFVPAREGMPPMAAWHNPECTESALLLPDGLSWGPCDGPHKVLPWAEGAFPAAARAFIETFAPFEAETPAGKILFNGSGTQWASSAEQRALAEWMKIQFLAASSGRPQADWGLALTYSRQGGFAGFCDDMKIYLDGLVLLSSCKDVEVDFRLNGQQLEQLYAWYDSLAKIEYSYTDPGTADAMSTSLMMPAQGDTTADDAVMNEILAFCAELVRQGRAQP